MSFFDDLLKNIGGLFSQTNTFSNKPVLRKGFMSPAPSSSYTPEGPTVEASEPLPTPTARPTAIPTPTPTPGARNPKVQQWLSGPRNRLKPDEMISGASIAAQESGIPFSLLMDIAGLESQAGMWDRPFDPKNQPGKYAGEQHARGPYMMLRSTAAGAGGTPEDRYSATESARLTAKKLKKGQLGEWDIADLPGAGGGRLTDFYSEEELNPYSFASLKRRTMLQELARQRGF